MANVNQSTVSRALSPGKAWMISPAKREEILRICKKYNYMPQKKEQRKILHKTYKVGFLLGSMEQDLTANTFGFMLRELCDHLQSSNYTLTLIRVDYTSSKLVENVKRILRSNAVDIYIAGAGLLKGQTMEFLQSMSSRLICYTPFCSHTDVNTKYRWISHITYDYENAFRKFTAAFPAELFESAVYIGSDVTDKWKFDTVMHSIVQNLQKKYNSPNITLDTEGVFRDQSYRTVYSLIDKFYPILKKYKLFICGSQATAQALTDYFCFHGAVLKKDFHITTFAAFSKLAENYNIQNDAFSVIGYDIETLAAELCELAMQLVDDPMPQKILVPALFQYGGSSNDRHTV